MQARFDRGRRERSWATGELVLVRLPDRERRTEEDHCYSYLLRAGFGVSGAARVCSLQLWTSWWGSWAYKQYETAILRD
jgi:hypothetical protein